MPRSVAFSVLCLNSAMSGEIFRDTIVRSKRPRSEFDWPTRQNGFVLLAAYFMEAVVI